MAPIVYWDTNVLLAWLKGESRSDVGQSDLMHWVRRFDDGSARLITCAITSLEILEARTPPDVRRRLMSYFHPPRAEIFDITPAILETAYQLRNHFASLPAPPGRSHPATLCVPDAIHLATAVQMQADRFHTGDTGKRGNSLGLLEIDNLQFLGISLKPGLPLADQGELALND